MDKTKTITPILYSQWRGCSLSNVTKCIRNDRIDLLPNVLSIKNWGRFYTLEVPEWLNEDTCDKTQFKRGRS